MVLIRKSLIWIACILGVSVVLIWLVLSSSLFSGVRTSLAESVLSRELGQDITIDGDVRIEAGSKLHVVAEGLTLQSPSMADVKLAELGKIEFDLKLTDLIKGKTSLSALRADGVQLMLVQAEDGSVSWSDKELGNGNSEGAATAKSKKPGKNPLDVLAGRSANFTNTKITYRSAMNGFEIELQLEALDVSSAGRTEPLEIKGNGAVNGEPMTLSGSFAGGGTLSTEIVFDKMSLTLEGSPNDNDEPDGWAVDIAVKIDALGQALDVLKLEKTVDGTGHVSAVFSNSNGVARIDDLDLLVSLDSGISLLVTGDMGELGNPGDMSVRTLIRMFPEDAEPAPTTKRKDLKLIAVDMEIASVPGQVAQRKMVIETNGFTLDTAGEGPPPIAVGQITRSQDGKLRLGKVDLRLGPPGEPFIILDGSVDDALQLEGVSGKGILDIPVASLIAPEVFQDSESLGRLTGGFLLQGNAELLALSDLEATSSKTDLWNLTVDGDVKNALRFEDVNLNIKAEVPSSASLLEAMTLEPVETGPSVLTIDLTSQDTDWNVAAKINVEDSDLQLSLGLDDATTEPALRGVVESDLIKVDNLRQIIAAALQLGRLNKLGEEEEEAPPETDAANDETEDTETEPAAETTSGPYRDVTLMPLGQAVLAAGLDVDVKVDLRKIEGAKAASSLQTELVLKDDQLSAGPLKFKYGGGHFDVSGKMDLTQETRLLEVVGSAGGWKLKEILELLKFKKGAGGTVYANFDISGPVTSGKGFVSAMKGSATISMNNGFIDSQLLDLAGLGVIPWLFSKDRKKDAQIVCMRAPLYVSNGNISTKQTVLETEQVQIVVFGNVNLNKKTLDINGQPRKIGEPLSKSPWPFTAKGSMAKPKIKVKDGPKRLRRTDGADKMPAKRKHCVPDILQLQ